jgi:hypothetical protein
VFCTPLDAITTAADVLGKITLFFEDEKIQWESSYDICEDSLLSMGSVFQAIAKKLAL